MVPFILPGVAWPRVRVDRLFGVSDFLLAVSAPVPVSCTYVRPHHQLLGTTDQHRLRDSQASVHCLREKAARLIAFSCIYSLPQASSSDSANPQLQHISSKPHVSTRRNSFHCEQLAHASPPLDQQHTVSQCFNTPLYPFYSIQPSLSYAGETKAWRWPLPSCPA